jgi:hypothetical protein
LGLAVLGIAVEEADVGDAAKRVLPIAGRLIGEDVVGEELVRKLVGESV